MNTSLAIVAAKALPAFSGSSLTYNKEKKIFMTHGYTSAAGNTYYQGIRVSDRLVVRYDIGQGYCYTFLNGIKLFAWDGQKAHLIAQQSWGGCNYKIFTEQFAKDESIRMLMRYLTGQAKALGHSISEGQLLEFSGQMIENIFQKRIV